MTTLVVAFHDILKAPRLVRLTPGNYPVPILKEAVLAPGTIWTGVENLASTGIRCPDRPAYSVSTRKKRYQFFLYRAKKWWLIGEC